MALFRQETLHQTMKVPQFSSKSRRFTDYQSSPYLSPESRHRDHIKVTVVDSNAEEDPCLELFSRTQPFGSFPAGGPPACSSASQPINIHSIVLQRQGRTEICRDGLHLHHYRFFPYFLFRPAKSSSPPPRSESSCTFNAGRLPASALLVLMSLSHHPTAHKAPDRCPSPAASYGRRPIY